MAGTVREGGGREGKHRHGGNTKAPGGGGVEQTVEEAVEDGEAEFTDQKQAGSGKCVRACLLDSGDE